MKEVKTMIDTNEVISLTQQLIQISSTNLSLGHGNGTGEKEIANFVSTWLSQRGFTVKTICDKNHNSRPSVVGVAKGKGGGKSLLFNGHLDTVSTEGYDGDPFLAEISGDGTKLYGRGSADMKGGLAAAMVAAATAADQNILNGDIIIAAVADEEDASIGSLAVLEHGLRAEAAIFPEPTNEAVVTCHRGFTWLEITCTGTSAHGSRYDLGRDAICDMGLFLSKLRQYDQSLANQPSDAMLGRGSLHAGTINGGVETSTYPAQCTVTIERRTLPGETSEDILAEIQAIICQTKLDHPSIELKANLILARPPLKAEQRSTSTFADLVVKHANKYGYPSSQKVGGLFWTDAALFDCPSIVYGPVGHGIHEEIEWVDTTSLRKVCQAYYSIAMEFCS